MQRAPITSREYPGEGSDSDGSRRPHRDQRQPDRGRYLTEVGDPLTKEDTLMEDPLVMEDSLGEDIQVEMGDPLGRGGYPGGGPSDGDGGPPDGGGPPGPPGGQGPPGPQGPPRPVRPI